MIKNRRQIKCKACYKNILNKVPSLQDSFWIRRNSEMDAINSLFLKKYYWRAVYMCMYVYI